MDPIRPDDARYDEASTIFNSMIDKRPAVVAQCATAADVREALQLATSEGYDVAVRAGGHSVAGVCLNDGGLVIDVRPMKDIHVDADQRQVRVGAGVTWGELDRATQEHGLATAGRRVSTTGVAGLTLGGGSGWTERAWGLSCDNLVAVDLVTADGREVTASDDQNPDLFWALHGGGGNFGVATSFVFRLHELGPLVTAGLMLWRGDSAAEIAREYRDFAAAAPAELGRALVFLTGPPEEFVPAHLQGKTLLGIAGLWVGDVDEGAAAMQPLKDLAPEVDLVGPMAYADFQCMIDDPLLLPWGGAVARRRSVETSPTTPPVGSISTSSAMRERIACGPPTARRSTPGSPPSRASGIPPTSSWGTRTSNPDEPRPTVSSCRREAGGRSGAWWPWWRPASCSAG